MWKIAPIFLEGARWRSGWFFVIQLWSTGSLSKGSFQRNLLWAIYLLNLILVVYTSYNGLTAEEKYKSFCKAEYARCKGNASFATFLSHYFFWHKLVSMVNKTITCFYDYYISFSFISSWFESTDFFYNLLIGWLIYQKICDTWKCKWL